MRLKLRDDGHPFQHLQALPEATSSDRVGEPSQFQARLVNIFLVFFLHTLSGALSFLPRAAVHASTTQDAPTGAQVAHQADARDTDREG